VPVVSGAIGLWGLVRTALSSCAFFVFTAGRQLLRVMYQGRFAVTFTTAICWPSIVT
jgi:hypothetical protein